MSVSIINPGVSGITVETDPTALKLTGGAISGDLTVAQQIGLGGVIPVSPNDRIAIHDGHIVMTAGFGVRFGDGTNIISTSNLAFLTGATFSGAVNLPTRSAGGVAYLNLGTIPNDLTAPTTLVEGDIYFTDSDSSSGFNTRLNYNGKNFAGTVTQYSLAVLQNSNFFTQPQTISCNTTSTQSALRVTNTGTGESLRIEDATNPDATPFIVANNGQTVIGGLTPYSTASLTVNGGASIESGSYYVRVDSGGVAMYGQLVLANQTTAAHSNAFTSYANEVAVTINGSTRYIPYR